MRHALAGLLLGLSIIPVPLSDARAQGNEAIVGVMADGRDDFGLAMRLAAALDHQQDLRILPMAGKGPVQTLSDLLFLKNVDAAILPSDVFAYAERNGLLKADKDKAVYLVKLGSLEVHLVARDGIDSIAGLAGKRVATGSTASLGFIAAHVLLADAATAVEEYPVDGEAAVTALAEGSVDAAFLVGTKPLPVLTSLKAKGLHLVALQAPAGAGAAYAPALITAADYPNLLRKQQTVETVSSALVIAVLDSPKGSAQDRKIARFAEGLFGALDISSAAGAGLNLAQTVPGWRRARAAEDMLKQRASLTRQPRLATTEN